VREAVPDQHGLVRKDSQQRVDVDVRGVLQARRHRLAALLEVPKHIVHVGGEQRRDLAVDEVPVDEVQEVAGDVFGLHDAVMEERTAGLRIDQRLFHTVAVRVDRQQAELLKVDEVGVWAEKVVLHVHDEHGCAAIEGVLHDCLISREGVPGCSDVWVNSQKRGSQVQSPEI
jgi:hypothetical protein